MMYRTSSIVRYSIIKDWERERGFMEWIISVHQKCALPCLKAEKKTKCAGFFLHFFPVPEFFGLVKIFCVGCSWAGNFC